MDFQSWLESKSIDCEALVPELLTTLQSQYELDCQLTKPPSEMLVVPVDCSWPSRGYWITSESAS